MYQISQYQVEDTPIGEGGMGRILLGYTPTGQKVAIKEILPEFAEDIELRYRISQEIHFLERLQHDAIVKTLDTFMFADKFYIVMELVEGLNLEQYVAQHGVFTEIPAMEVMSKILEVMQFVHSNSIVHRDLKPSNIMIRSNGDICLLDFGIAKDLRSKNTRTQFGSVIGSDGYMSPEQASGCTIDARSDIYALGCVFYFMLTGQHAFSSQASHAELVLAVTEGPFPKLTTSNTQLSKEAVKRYEAILEHATNRNMMQRFQSCDEFREAFLPPKPKPSVGTVVSGSNAGRCVVTLGREGCDICFNDPNFKVSRHHAEIELRSFTGGSFYVFRDDSSNGSVIGNSLVHHMAYHIPAAGPLPVILLAGDPQQQVDWNVVIPLLQKRKAELERVPTSQPVIDPVGGTQADKPLPSGVTDIPSLDEPSNTSGLFIFGILLVVMGIVCIIASVLLLNAWVIELVSTIVIALLGGCMSGLGLMLALRNK